MPEKGSEEAPAADGRGGLARKRAQGRTNWRMFVALHNGQAVPDACPSQRQAKDFHPAVTSFPDERMAGLQPGPSGFPGPEQAQQPGSKLMSLGPGQGRVQEKPVADAGVDQAVEVCGSDSSRQESSEVLAARRPSEGAQGQSAATAQPAAPQKGLL